MQSDSRETQARSLQELHMFSSDCFLSVLITAHLNRDMCSKQHPHRSPKQRGSAVADRELPCRGGCWVFILSSLFCKVSVPYHGN